MLSSGPIILKSHRGAHLIGKWRPRPSITRSTVIQFFVDIPGKNRPAANAGYLEDRVHQCSIAYRFDSSRLQSSANQFGHADLRVQRLTGVVHAVDPAEGWSFVSRAVSCNYDSETVAGDGFGFAAAAAFAGCAAAFAAAFSRLIMNIT